LQHLLRRLLARDRGIVVQRPESGETPPVRYNGHAVGAPDGVVPWPAPFVTDDAAIDRAAREIEALRHRIAGAIGAAKGQLADADTEIAALRQQLAGAQSEIASLKAGVAAAGRERAALQESLAAASGQASALEAEAAALKEEAATLKAESATWRAQLYKSERMLIDELDRLVQRALAAAAPEPSADAAAPEVSVVMPVFNRPELLTIAVRSVLAQRYRRWELIVVDDGSSDDIAGAMRPFLADPRIRLVRQANAGECAARNHGLRLARGEIVAYLDSDNFWYPDFLAAAAELFRADPELLIAYGAIAYDWPNGDVRFYLLPFDRAELLRDNLADVNVVVHRRSAFERFGGFDETLTRAVEWDLMLRYTVDRPAAHIPVVAARYRIHGKDRQSSKRPLANNKFRIRRKWWAQPDRAPRALFAAGEAAAAGAASAHLLGTEIACMRRFGAAVAIWAPGPGAWPAGEPFAADCVVHRGTLAAAIAAVRPDVVHLHGLDALERQRATLADAGVPVTVRGRGADTAPAAIARALELPNLAHVYLLPGAGGPARDPRLRHAAPLFDTTLFAPAMSTKDRRLVLRAAPGLARSDLRFMLELAKRVPEHRVVVAIARIAGHEAEIEALRAYRDEIGSPAEILIDAQRAELVRMFAAAGLYVHSAPVGGPPRAGGPVSLAEAMATGAHVLARKTASYAAFLGHAGALYGNLEEAAALIRATLGWSDADWCAAQIRAIDRAFTHHADEIVLRPMFEDWCAIARDRAAAATAMAAAAAL
jgi:GT2 family glycosyltransferase